MRKLLLKVFSFILFSSITFQLFAQDIVWTTKSKKARECAERGINHFVNIERELAYNDMKEALNLDPDFTIAQLFMALINVGEVRRNYASMAMKSVANKPESEKLLVSLLDSANSADSRRQVWEKLHNKYPGNPIFSFYYSNSRATDEERFTTMQDFINKFPNVPYGYNTMGYTYLNYKKDTAMAKQNFEKYISLYPDGSNPYDSMGDYYLAVGDKENAKKYFTMALEKYPFFVASVEKLDELNKEEPGSEK